jgi:hypothetical protein
MQETLSVIKEADDISLMTLYYARLGLNLALSTDPTIDEQLEMFIRWSSDEIAKLCNRVFARETVDETFRDFGDTQNRIFLSHYPVVEITNVTEDGVVLVPAVDYELDVRSGCLTRLGSAQWLDPVVVSYTGGYNLPYDAPEALQQATLLMIREAYYAAIRGDATIRMIGHKEARVIYFDPNARSGAVGGGSGGGGGSVARRTIDNLLKKYTRFWI